MRLLLALGLLVLAPATLAAQRATPRIDPSVTLDPPQGRTRTIDFTTDEGTYLALDLSPDGRWIAFDLLGQVYRMPAGGGAATCLTENSGLALNFHPAISPDGQRIAFISDRQGQNNVWVMGADGSAPTAVWLDRDTRFMHPTWAPDGRSLVVVRVFPTPGRGWHRQTAELWRVPLDGGAPSRLLGAALTQYDAPAFSPNGRFLYYHVAFSTGEGTGLLFAGHRIQRLELATGLVDDVRDVRPRVDSAYLASLRRTGYAQDVPGDPPAALTPVVSPDARWVAFGLERPGEAMAWRGHRFTPRTSLAIRDLATGEERIVLDTAAKDLTLVNAQYSYGPFPRYAWTRDGRALIAWAGGHIRRIPIDGGPSTVVPFQARVHRTLSEMARTRLRVSDATHRVQYLQWPVATRDGTRLAFVAAGRLYVMALPGGTPRAVAALPDGAIPLTPAWSPDGRQLAFTAWSDTAGGSVWVADAAGTTARALALPAAEYAYPAWSLDGRTLVVTRGPGAPANGSAWNGWTSDEGWEAWRVPLEGGAPSRVVALAGFTGVSVGTDGRLRFLHQAHPEDARLLSLPFPSAYALGLRIEVRSVAPDGSDPRVHASFPALAWPGSDPRLSPDGRWVAFQAGAFAHVAPVPPGPGAAPGDSAHIVQVQADPRLPQPGRVRVFDAGAVDYSWRDATTLQMASGARYVTWDAAAARRTVTPVALTVPRPVVHGAILLANAQVITMEGDRVLARGDVVVRGARIACVAPAGGCDTRDVARRLDLTGKTILPGLVDMHAHHATVPGGIVVPHHRTAALDLAYGVTTILDPSTNSRSAFPLAEMTEAGVVLGPRTFSSAEPVIFPGTTWGFYDVLRSQADADREVDRRADWGAASIKNYRQAGRWQQQFLLNAARRRGVSVTSEGGPLYFDVGQVLDGQAGWEHLLATLPVYADAARFFGAAGITYSPTSIVAGHVAGSKEWFRPRQGLATDAKYQRFAPPDIRRVAASPAPDADKATFSFPIIAEGLADIMRAGGHGALGEHGEQPGIGTHWELWAYAEALRPIEALRAGTMDGARFLGLDRDIGSVTRGKVADLVILDADPLADIHNSARIGWVMKEGRLFDAATLDEQWPGTRRFTPGGPPR